jgi:hypothetical protein
MTDPNVLLWWVVFCVLVIVDVLFWILGIVLDSGSGGRFRALTTAALLLYVVLGMVVGWGIAAVICLVGLWVFAVIANAVNPDLFSEVA